jgi:hypothetical protein
MPKRVIDGEGVWRSDKFTQVEPPSFRAEYTNLLPLALANGSFEVNARCIWSTVYSYNRPDITIAHVEQILAEFERKRERQKSFHLRSAKLGRGAVWQAEKRQGTPTRPLTATSHSAG